MDRQILYRDDNKKITKIRTEVIVIGSGIAGMTAALELSKDLDVTLLTKSDINSTATWLAQGGLAATVSKSDSPLYHIKDTVVAGDGLCNIAAVEILVKEGPKYVNDLIKLGTRFDTERNKFRLGREGGHSRRRILHFKDLTGTEIQNTLAKAGTAFASVNILTYHFATDLIVSEGRVCGVIAVNVLTGKPKAVLADKVIIASGGAGQVYKATSNPEVATGDGIAMAYRAGATVSDLEFMQFHPTVFFKEGRAAFLITEALRGEGALLLDVKGSRIMEGIHPLRELAPRDVVSRQIFMNMHKTGADHVLLDATHITKERSRSRFPAVWEFLNSSGIDMSKVPIPVAPAAHYLIGGIKADLNGRSDIEGLYACGEAAATGVHGANRLASNSLLEGLVFGRRIAEDMKAAAIADPEKKSQKRARQDQAFDVFINRAFERGVPQSLKDPLKKERSDLQAVVDQLKETMSVHVSFERNNKDLRTALAKVKRLREDLAGQGPSVDTSVRFGYEAVNMLIISELMIRSALKRTESRGVHFRTDFPRSDDKNWLKNINIKDDKITTSRVPGISQ